MSEEVIEENINDDSREATAGRLEELFGLQKDGVLVGEAVDGPVEHDSGDDVIRKARTETNGGAGSKITQECTDAGGIGGMGKMEVGEEVQNL